MDILVLNDKLEAVTVIDSYETFTWADRYNDYGDFELHTAIFFMLRIGVLMTAKHLYFPQIFRH